MNATIRDRAKANRLVVETDAERRPPKGKAAPKDTAAVGEELPTVEEIGQMTPEELEAELPTVEEELESVQSELEALQGRRDEALGVVGAMRGRLAALEAGEEETA